MMSRKKLLCEKQLDFSLWGFMLEGGVSSYKIINKEHKGITITMIERLLEHHGLVKKTDLHTL